MPDPRVSVIIPTFNRVATLPRAIRSVLDQTHPAHEIIIVDDGSTDATSQLVGLLIAEDERIRYVKQPNRGAPAARNRGARIAEGDFIAFQDSDDEWRPTFLENLLAMHTKSRTVAFCSLLTVDDNRRRTTNYNVKIERPETLLLSTNCISTQTALIDAALMENHSFDESLMRFQDWDLWLGMLDEAHFVHLPEVLATQHLQGDSLTLRRNTLDAGLRTIIRKHWRTLAREPRSLTRFILGAFLIRPLRDGAVLVRSLIFSDGRTPS